MNLPRRLALCLLLSFAAWPGGLAAEQAPVVETVEDLRTRTTTTALREEARTRLRQLESDLAEARAEDDESEEEDIEEAIELLQFADEWLARALASAAETDLYDANAYVERLLRTQGKDLEVVLLPPLTDIVRNVFLGGLVGQPLPRMGPRQRHRPLGDTRADKEAANLHLPGRSNYFSPATLAAMTPDEVAELDVSPEHPVWYDRRAFTRIQDPVAHFESRMRRGVSAVLKREGDLGGRAHYPMEAARRVLFLEEIYLSATSPKGTAEDAFGVEWKLKWGDEVAIEPVAGRLYLLAGGKATDLVYSNRHGPEAMVLVLMDPEEAEEDRQDEKDDERYPTTLEELKASVDEFYHFDLAPYITAHGVITEDNLHSILRHHPGAGKKKYRPEKMVGRHWVAFKESSMEFKPQGYVERHDGSRMSDVAAVHDRAYRGMYLFNLWIANRDVKDDNNKSYFFRDGEEGRISQYREGHHDLGLALGSLWGAGEINQLPAGDTFARRGLFGRVRVPQAIIFRPSAWDAATWADLKWMAGNLVRISDHQIRDAVAASNWPDFVQEALVYKLVSRRDRIGELFGIEGHPAVPAAPPTLTLSLPTPARIAAVETRYGLAPGSLAAELSGHLTGPGYRETVLHEGRIADCRRSAVVRALTRQRHPSGLDVRYHRMNQKPPGCLDPR